MSPPRTSSPRRLAITADDFGADVSVNAAIEAGHRDGVLTTASLMVTAPATDDAIACARRNPELGVGLHLVLTDGQSCLPPHRIPHLVDTHGRFDNNMVRAGARFACDPRTRRELATEIRAQFAAFAATGLALDHVNAHKHFHMHPTILRLILEIGSEFGLHAIRWPHEPTSARVYAGGGARRGETLVMQPWLWRMRRQIEKTGLTANDNVLGLTSTGHTTCDVLAGLIDRLPPGRSEIYLHPALANDWPGSPAGADHRGEYEALTASATRATIEASGARLVTFGEL